MKCSVILCGLLIMLCNSVSAQDIQYNAVLSHGLKFEGTPYEAATLEVNDTEQLVINLEAFDCTTFVETVLAMAMCTENGQALDPVKFAENLQKIRYRDGIINGYASRLHYATDWVADNVRKGILEDITAAYSPFKQRVTLNYMSTHPLQYKQLANSPALVDSMKVIEERLSRTTIAYLPKDELGQEGKPWIQNGDIILITTNIPGLDCSHMGIAIYIYGNLHLLHASSAAKKVEVSKLMLNRYLARQKNSTGIRVVRLKGKVTN